MHEVSAEEAAAYVSANAALLQACGVAAEEGAKLRVTALAQGEHNANFLLSSKDETPMGVLRINYVSQLGLPLTKAEAQPGEVTQIGYEKQALTLLEPSGVTPRVLYWDETGACYGHGVLVESFMEGRLANYKDEADLKRAIKTLAEIHCITVGEQSSLQRPRNPLATQYEECLGHLSVYENSGLADPTALKRLRWFAQETEKALDCPFDEADACHILNTEAVPSHFLISETGCAVVDWEKPIVGEVAQDLAYFLSPTTTIWDTEVLFTAEQRRELIELYWEAVAGRFDKGLFQQRFDAYAKTNCLRGLTWSAAAWVEYQDPARPLKNEKTARKLTKYLSQDFLDFCEGLIYY